MVQSLLLALAAFAIGLAFGPFWLAFLRGQRMGKQMNPSEPEENRKKEGTPTLGGVIFLVPIATLSLIFLVWQAGRLVMLVAVGLTVACAVLGALDDLQTLLKKQRSVGLSPLLKLAVETALSLTAAGALAYAGMTEVTVPLVGDFVLPAALYVPFAAFVLLCSMNAVGITDGLDSLAASTSAIAFLAFWIIGLLLGYPLSAGLSAICVGALLAYLWFNAHPALVFMGDVGSLPLGALLAMVALLERQPFLLLPVGVIFVSNVLTDLLQVGSVKLRGTRLFRIAPLHNHFQKVGWPETWIVQRFWIIGAVGGLVGVLLAVTRP